MGIVSGIANIVQGAAKAFTPKQEPPPPEPAQIMIVDGRQKTNREQVQEWANGGEAPDRVKKIHNNISNLYASFEVDQGSPEALRGLSMAEESPTRVGMNRLNFDISGRQPEIRKIKTPAGNKSSKKFPTNRNRKSKRAQKNSWKIDVGRWRL